MTTTQRSWLVIFALAAVVIGGAWQAADKWQPVQKWEYTSTSGSSDRLTRLGDEGWELVAIDSRPSNGSVYWFNREMREQNPAKDTAISIGSSQGYED